MDDDKKFGAFLHGRPSAGDVAAATALTEQADTYLEALADLAQKHGRGLRRALTIMVTDDGGVNISAKGMGREDMLRLLERIVSEGRARIAEDRRNGRASS